jgi:hypothetical protein
MGIYALLGFLQAVFSFLMGLCSVRLAAGIELELTS